MYYPDIRLEGLSLENAGVKIKVRTGYFRTDSAALSLSQPALKKWTIQKENLKKTLLKVAYGVVCDTTGLSRITDRSGSRISLLFWRIKALLNVTRIYLSHECVLWYVNNQTLHTDLNIPYINYVIKEKITTHHNKLASHSNDILQPLVEPQHNLRLRRNWPADLKEN
jgi:hypothetical protein